MRNPPTPFPVPMPVCWDRKENWVEWQRFNVLTRDDVLDHHCADCTPEYKARMIAAGRCAYPEVRFVRIIERQYDPVTMQRRDVLTDAIKGVR